jgi:hypothetical protein
VTASTRAAAPAGLETINPLDHPIIFATPRRLPVISAWREHIPFAMLVVDLVRPTTFVELGTHYGTSYCAFCQAVDELALETRCYAVDTWEGDEHSGTYGAEVLADLRAHHDPLYGSFSRLVQSTFDDALVHFEGGSIDLLHIDGYHTYEAVRHDFDGWLPKMSDRGVVLVHDINTRERDFGVWRFWEETRDTYPHLELLHAHGLGVLAVGPDQPAPFRALLALDPERLLALRELFFQLGYRLRLELQLERARELARDDRARLESKLEATREETERKLREKQEELRETQERLAETARELDVYSSNGLARTAVRWRRRGEEHRR